MSNETELNWLARNVHVWPEGKCEVFVCWPRNVDTLIWSSVLSDTGRITKAQWLARRAELQNKPSWSEIQDWVNWIMQSSTGLWFGSDREPEIDVVAGHSFVNPSSFRLGVTFGDGEVLGDWRDTLEKRPEQDEFEPFVSVEDAKITIMQSDGDVKNFGGIISRSLPLKEDAATAKQPSITPSKYTKTIHGVSVDVYDVLQAWGVTNPALQHLIKKALQCGQRGHKDNAQDLQDIIDSAIRAKELG